MSKISGNYVKEIRKGLNEKNKFWIYGEPGIGKSTVVDHYVEVYKDKYTHILKAPNLCYVFYVNQFSMNEIENNSDTHIELMKKIDNWFIVVDFAHESVSDREMLDQLSNYIPLNEMKPQQHLVIIRNNRMDSALPEYNNFSFMEIKEVSKENCREVFHFQHTILSNEEYHRIYENVTKGSSKNEIGMFSVKCQVEEDALKQISKKLKISNDSRKITLLAMKDYGLLDTVAEGTYLQDCTILKFRKPEYCLKLVNVMYDSLFPNYSKYKESMIGFNMYMYLETKLVTPDTITQYVQAHIMISYCFLLLLEIGPSIYYNSALERSLYHLDQILKYIENQSPSIQYSYYSNYGYCKKLLETTSSYEEAAKFYLKALEMDQKHPDQIPKDIPTSQIMKQIAECYKKLKNYKMSLTYYQEALKSTYKFRVMDPTIFEELVDVYYQLGDNKKAIFYANKCTALRPYSYTILALAYAKEKRWKESKSTMKELKLSYSGKVGEHMLNQFVSVYNETIDNLILQQSFKKTRIATILLTSTLTVGFGFLLYRYLKK
ncbi:hypothetical protein DLAC_08951 [Tieghemostelium lacteum]|uniref:Uncharacterized protein n=1 Tax=Tieghemostelium lacteum TaxID=361077 RepID=A0A151Z8P6_TIELA|nr:hypothetical protein DLAC_08951 [Tieghemostelium lacteum]|eukprot:KYQ90339.1 hypothetical protein DLAC_08951 [Tieghemostelium lacteum]